MSRSATSATYKVVVFLIAIFAGGSTYAQENSAIFSIGKGAQSLPLSGPESFCRQPDIEENVVKTFASSKQLRNINVTVTEFESEFTISVSDTEKTFACHGTFKLSNGQSLPGVFSVETDTSGVSIWAWKNDIVEPPKPERAVENQKTDSSNSSRNGDQVNTAADTMSISMTSGGLDQYLGITSWAKVMITSRVDKLYVSSIQANRGNCNGKAAGVSLPATLIFGDTLTYGVFPCHLISVTVVANGQMSEFTFGTPEAEGEVLGVEKFGSGSQNSLNFLRITSYEAVANIKEIVVNRGNCQVDSRVSKFNPPRALRYGETLYVGPLFCDALEVTVLNDKMPIVVNW